MTKYILKNRNFYFKANDVFKDFDEAFQKACNMQMSDELSFVTVRAQCADADVTCQFNIKKKDIKVAEDLKPFVWYDRGKFDGNPNKYIIMECTVNNEEEIMYIASTTYPSNTNITKKCTKFMYIKKLYQ